MLFTINVILKLYCHFTSRLVEEKAKKKFNLFALQMVPTDQPSLSPPKVHALLKDITQLSVDVIVNAANERMDHAGGLARQIVLKGENVTIFNFSKLQPNLYDLFVSLFLLLS